jgi:hypothetical protein
MSDGHPSHSKRNCEWPQIKSYKELSVCRYLQIAVSLWVNIRRVRKQQTAQVLTKVLFVRLSSWLLIENYSQPYYFVMRYHLPVTDPLHRLHKLHSRRTVWDGIYSHLLPQIQQQTSNGRCFSGYDRSLLAFSVLLLLGTSVSCGGLGLLVLLFLAMGECDLRRNLVRTAHPPPSS